MLRLALGAALVVATASLSACNDPPGDAVLIIDLVGDNSNATDITGLGFSPNRVELMISDTLTGEPRPVVVPDSGGTTLTLTFDASHSARDTVSMFSPRAGFLHEVRFIEDGVTILGPAAQAGLAVAKVPSGTQTGIKISPADGVPFELQRFRNTRIEVSCDVGHQVNRPEQTGFHFKPSLKAVLVESGTLQLVPFDRVAAKFFPSVSEARIAELIAARNMGVLARWRLNNYYVLSLPSTTTLAAALADLDDLPEVQVTLPDVVMGAGITTPDDDEWARQTQFTQVNFDDAWDTGTGTSEPIVAIVDNGVDLDHRDLIANMFINVREIPPATIARLTDTNGDGTIDWRDIDFNGDNDGVLEFPDLDSAANVALGLCPRANNAPAAQCDPLDLVDGTGSTTYGWQDGVDNDNPDGHNTFVDDIVGWNFESGNNLPVESGGAGTVGAHGTEVAGVAGAVGNNATDIAGASWRLRILPVRIGWAPGRTPRFAERVGPYKTSAIIGINYAALIGADIINLSSGFYVQTGEAPPAGCRTEAVANGVAQSKLNAFRDILQTEMTTSLALGTSVLVPIAHNCPFDIDSAGVFEWPSSFKNNQFLVVGSVAPLGNMSPFSATGGTTVDIAAPGENYLLLQPGNGTTDSCGGAPGDCDGTSLAAPMVAGATALVLSLDLAGLRGQPCRLVDRVLRNAGTIVGPTGSVAGDRLLDADRAVRDVVTAPVRECP